MHIHKPLLLLAAFAVGAQNLEPLGSVAPPVAAPIPPVATALPLAHQGWWDVMGRDSLPSDSLEKISISIGVMPGIDPNGREPRKVSNAFSLALVAAEAGAITGVQLTGGMNDVHGSVQGIQGAGLNLVGGNLVGVQGAGINLVHGNVTGVQYGYLFNRVGGDLDGIQFSSFGNLVRGEVRGVQSAGIVNRAGSLWGVQDGLLNVVDRARGLQTGMVNVADTITGVQFGLVNVAKNMVGPQIGLINIRPDSRVFVETWSDEVGFTHLGLNYGSPGWYNLVDFASTQNGRAALGMGFGGRLPSKRLILSLDMSASLVMNIDQLDRIDSQNRNVELSAEWNRTGTKMHMEGDPDVLDAMNGLFRARATIGWHIWKRLAIFGGVSWNTLVAPEKGLGTLQLRPYGSYHWDADAHVRMWPGAFAGIRF